MKMLLCVYLGSAFLAVVITPLVIRLAHGIGAMDRPRLRAVHHRPVPRIGGVAIFLSVMCTIGAVVFLNDAVGEAFRGMQGQLTALLGSATFIFLIGLADDLKASRWEGEKGKSGESHLLTFLRSYLLTLSPSHRPALRQEGLPAKFKLLAELLAAGVLCLAGVRISSVALTEQWVLLLGGWGCLATILWVVGITNAVNLSDGLDGLAAGICAITCGMIAIFAIQSKDAIMATLMLALLGSLCGFLVFNFNPAKVFMGDCGSLFLGFTIAASSVMCVAKSTALVGLMLPALALGVPIFDTLLAILRRFLEGRSVFAPDRNHFHHHLLSLGLHQRDAVILIYLATLLAAGLGLFMLAREGSGSLVIFGGVLLLIVLLFRAVGAMHPRQILWGLRQKHVRSQQARDERRTFEHLQLCVRELRSDGRTAVDSVQARWQTVCEAAQQLDLAWVSLEVTNANGSMETTIWRRQNIPPEFARIITMSFPVSGTNSVQFEVGILVNGSLQSASHRAGLFVRLADECSKA